MNESIEERTKTLNMLNADYDVQTLNLIIEADKACHDIEEDAYDYAPRGFTFFASNREAYYKLKALNPEFAIQYIEALIDYGCVRKPLPDSILIQSLLCGTTQAIDKAYRAYCKKIEQSEREERRKIVDEYMSKQKERRK